MFKSKLFKGVLLGLAVLIIILVVFQAGIMVGFKKANFSFRWGENYHRNFGGPERGWFGNMMGRDDYREAQGAFGQIIKIDTSSITVKDRNNTEKVVLLSDKTVISRFRENIKQVDLKIDDQVVIIGELNESGQVEAKLIRVMPAPPMANSPATTTPTKQ